MFQTHLVLIKAIKSTSIIPTVHLFKRRLREREVTQARTSPHSIFLGILSAEGHSILSTESTGSPDMSTEPLPPSVKAITDPLGAHNSPGLPPVPAIGSLHLLIPPKPAISSSLAPWLGVYLSWVSFVFALLVVLFLAAQPGRLTGQPTRTMGWSRSIQTIMLRGLGPRYSV